MKKTTAPDERRRFMRLPLGISVKFKALEDTLDTANLRTTQVKNLSEGGILFKSPKPLPGGSVLQIKLDFTGVSRRMEVAAIGRVIRCQRSAQGFYAIGTQFLQIHPDDFTALKAFIDRESKRKLVPKPAKGVIAPKARRPRKE